MTQPVSIHVLNGRIGAHARWEHTVDRTAATAPARAGLQRRFEDEVDPERVLDPATRAMLAESARRKFYARIARDRVRTRRARRGAA